MPSLAVETYDKLRIKIGEENTRTIIEYIDSKVEGTTVTKLDLEKTENGLRADINKVQSNLEKVEKNIAIELERIQGTLENLQEEKASRLDLEKVENKLRMEMQDIRWQIKLYFIITSALILFTNPKVLEIIGKIFKSVF